VKRREFIALVGGAAAWPISMHAQQSSRLRVGTVSGQPRTASLFLAFEQRMAELGYQEGRNFSFEHIHASNFEDYGPGYRKLVADKVDLLVASGPEISLKSALEATNGLPIVMVAIDYDPFALGYVKELARPSGNVTGVFFRQIELTTKRLQLWKDGFPERQSLTVLWDRISADQWLAAQGAGATLGLRLAGVEMRGPPYDYERSLADVAAEYRGSLFVLTSPFFFRDRVRLAELALGNRMVTMFPFREWTDVGGLMSYGPSITNMYRRAAEYADRIARGAKPSDLPIEQPTKFELVMNLKTAKALGLTIGPSLLARADELVE
jgi:putative ABC transport system substrate-binding protein